MLHNLATKKEFLKKGFGTLLTRYMMLQAKKLGYQHCFLEASEGAFNLYKRIGFKIYSVNSSYQL